MATKEEDNFLRVVYLNYRVGTTALRRYFDCIHPNLPSDLSSPINKAILLGLHKPPRGQRKVLYQEQWNVLYPSSGSPAVSSANLDVTLMVCLLRNVPPKVSQPPNGFDVLPQSGDLSPGAHIARIKYYKNYLVSHSKDGKLSDADFNIIWIDLEMAINGLGSQQDATDAVDAKSKVLDYKALNELVNFGGGIQRNLKRLNDYSNELAVHTSKIRKLETTVENMEKEAQSVKKDVDVRSSKGTFNKLKDELLRSSILDREVLDNLISKCVLLLDDKEEIDSFPDQLSRNQKLLEILMHRPYNTFNMFVEAVKESDQQCHTSLVVNMESRFSDKISKVPHKKDIADVEKQTVKLIKWFKTLSHEIDTDIAGILDKLSAKGVISYEENSKIRLANITPQEKFRGLLENIIRKNVSSASTIFIKVLQEECCYQEYATKIEETDVTQFDLELLYIGRITRERKKKKKERKTRKRNGMTDLMIDKIETWDKDDSRYIHTRATDHVLTCINKHKCVSVTGPSGSGKTAMVRHVALQMETNGYTILPVRDGKEMIDHYKSDRKTLYIVDDMCGHFTANQKRIEKWKKLINDVQSILENSKYKLILTCRLQVFQDKGFENLVIFKACECNLRSRNLSLTSDEKKKMTMAYFKEHSSEALKHLGEYEFLPLLCKLYYVEKTNPQFTLEIFLNDPFSFYVKELTHMYNDCKEGKYKYCALLLLVIFNNKLEEKHLTGKDPKLKEHIEDIIEVCEISENITGRKLRTELEILTGTFVTNDEGIYQTIHDKLFDFLAFYFGTQEQLLTLLINNANGRFLRERFVVANKTESANYSIPIPDDKLKMYMKRIFDDMVTSSSVYINITENRNFMNVEFSNMFLDYMKHLTQPEKSELIKIANSNFFSRIFVLKEEDINHNCYGESECFGIVIPADSLQQYIEQLFDHLTKSDSVSSFIRGNRPLQNVSFCTAFRSYIKQLNTEQIAFRIKTGHASFLNEMFVMTDDVIDNNSRHRHECFAIVIPDDLLQEYIERWFYHLTQSAWPIMFVDRNRPLMSIRYRTALHSYMKHLKTETIFSFIEYGEADFMNIMFVMREDDIKENAENRYESFGFVIPGGMLQRYIEKWFDHLINTCDPDKFMDKNRPLMNDSFCIAFRSYIGQLKIETIANLIKTTTDGFLNTMFVMTDDDIKTIAKRRYECFGIVLPENLLNQYINRWFYHLTKSSHPIGWMNRNRLLVSGTFRTALRSYMTQLKTETIASLIQIGNADFLNTLFVMRNDDFKDNAKNRFESVGIVIPDDLLQKYIERWFDHLAKQILPIHFMDWNRQLMNLTFRTALRSYTKLLNTKTIASLIQVGNARFVNTMFVMTDDDIKDNAENRVDCVGIVIPDDLLHQYIERWFDHLAKQIFPAEFMETNRSFMNVTFRTALRSYTKQLNTETIASLIQIGNAEFLNTMFVTTKDDIKGNAENRVDCVGIVLPDNMFQQYIERWFDGMIQSVSIDKYIDVSRCLNDVSFQKSLRTYIKQLSREKIDKIIQRGNSNFLNMMFVMTEEDIKDNAENRYECFGIVIPNDLLQQYIERWFDDLADIRWNHWTSGSMERFINKNRVLVNVRGRTAIKNVIRNIHEEKIEKLIQKGRSHFLNIMFVMTEDDIKDNTENRHECFGIIVPDYLLQQFVESWFDGMTNKNFVKIKSYIVGNRSVINETFRVALQKYLRQLSMGKIETLIQSGNIDFVNSMFVMTDENVKDIADDLYEYFGIVIPNDLLHHYSERWLDDLRKTDSVKEYIDRNRSVSDVAFRIAMQAYIKNLPRAKILNLLQTGSTEFVNTMFVMTEGDIKDNTGNQWECFGIVLPGDLLQQYIAILFDGLTKVDSVKKYTEANRCLMNANFQNTMQTYIKQLNRAEIENLIQTGSRYFLNTMFVMMEDDIKDNTDNRYECLGIILPDDMLQQYIGRWFDCITKTELVAEYIRENRLLMNVTGRATIQNYIRHITEGTIETLIQSGNKAFFNTMFVTTEYFIKDTAVNRYAYVGIVIPDNLLQQYIERWFNNLTKTDTVREYINCNRCVNANTFRIALQTYIKQLTRRKIGNLQRTASQDFVNTMFVMTEDDIKDNAEHQWECLGIVLPDDLLQQYIERLFDGLTKANLVKKSIDANRCFMNGTFRIALQTYIKQLTHGKIRNLIQTGSRDFVNTMFVMTEDDIKENTVNRLECFGIVVVDDMLQQYFERWFDSVTRTESVKEDMNVNRILMNATGKAAMQHYIRRINAKRIGTLIQIGNRDFFNTMFVVTEDDIKDNADNRYECFGIIIPADLLEQYIGRLVDGLTKTYSVKKCLDFNRCFMNVTFRIALQTYMKQLTRGNIANLIQTGSRDFVNTMFVLAEDDIKEDSENRQECFGIIMPDDLLHQYIERWFDGMTKTDSAKQYIDENRTFMNSKFQANLDLYINGINLEKIRCLNRKGQIDYLNTRQGLFKENRTYEIKS